MKINLKKGERFFAKLKEQREQKARAMRRAKLLDAEQARPKKPAPAARTGGGRNLRPPPAARPKKPAPAASAANSRRATLQELSNEFPERDARTFFQLRYTLEAARRMFIARKQKPKRAPAFFMAF